MSESTLSYLLLALAILYPIVAFILDRMGKRTWLATALRYVLHFGIGAAESFLRKRRERARANKPPV